MSDVTLNTGVIPANPKPTAPEYRAFFATALFVILTTGAGWGLWFLLQIAMSGRVTGVGLHEINAHAQTVIYGFLGLFIMGFAYQAFPRLWNQPLAHRSWCMPVLLLTTGGVAMLAVAELQAETTLGKYLVIVGGVIQTIGVGLFFFQLFRTFREGKTPFNAVTAMLLTAAGFLVIHTPLNAWHTWNLVNTESKYEAIYYTSVYQPALRYLQFHGMVLLMIFGVSSRLLTSFFAIPKPSERKLWVILTVVTICVFAEAGIFVAFRLLEDPRIAAFLLLPWAGLLAASIALVWPWKIWRTWKDQVGRVERMGKFARASYAWLIVSLLMTIAQPGWSHLIDTYFSHGWYGASRQAFTVGFATMMIIAFTSKVVPTLNGVLPTALPRLNSVFVLVNLGLLLHIVAQIATEVYPISARVLPIAGVMQWMGLMLWAAHLIHCMIHGMRADRPSAKSGVSLRVLGQH